MKFNGPGTGLTNEKPGSVQAEKKGGDMFLKCSGIIGAVSTLVCLQLFACNNKDVETLESEGGSGAVRSSTPVPVKTLVTRRENFVNKIQVNGRLKSARELVLVSENDGVVNELNVAANQMLKPGTIILKMETISLENKLEKTKLVEFNCRKEYESQLLGYKPLLQGKSLSDADTIIQKLLIGSGLAAARQDIKELEYDISKSTITTPFRGVIADIKIKAGQQIRAGQEMFRIYDPENFLLETKILETDLGGIELGAKASVTTLANRSEPIRAFVSEINPYVDENGMITIWLKITAPPHFHQGIHHLFPGMNCIADLEIPLGKAITIPKTALVMRGGKAVVFTLENGSARWNKVVVGRDNGRDLEIRGISPGKKVIVSNNLLLNHGTPVVEVDSALQVNDNSGQ